MEALIRWCRIHDRNQDRMLSDRLAPQLDFKAGRNDISTITDLREMLPWRAAKELTDTDTTLRWENGRRNFGPLRASADEWLLEDHDRTDEDSRRGTSERSIQRHTERLDLFMRQVLQEVTDLRPTTATARSSTTNRSPTTRNAKEL